MNLFTRTSCPDALTECRSIFDKLVAQQSHDTHVVDALMDPSTENPSHQRRFQPLASDLSEAFAEIPYLKPHATSRVHYLTHLTQHGIRYSICSRHAYLMRQGSKDLLALNISSDCPLSKTRSSSPFINIKSLMLKAC